jgi:hypothetical protein
LEANAPVSDTQPPLVVNAGELNDVAGWWFARETIERVDDAPADRRIETL